MGTQTDPRDARAEARAALERAGVAAAPRVLEPSPPAVVDDWMADDPVAVLGEPGPVVSPLPGTAHRWVDVAAGDASLAAFAEARWLGPWRALAPLPSAYEAARGALHRLAVYVVSPAREAVTGKIGLRSTLDGFGTPFFGDDEQVRVEGIDLVHQRGASVVRAPITTLRAAAELVGVPLDPGRAERFDVPRLGDPDEPLAVDAPAARALADWYGFATSVLEELRATAPGGAPSRVQLWPEHFDPAVEVGDEAVGARAGYGASPGDAWHPAPYLYVSVWDRDRLAGDLADDARFDAPFGAVLGLDALLAADDQRATALDFYRGALAALAA